jgi:hypothetical protein
MRSIAATVAVFILGATGLTLSAQAAPLFPGAAGDPAGVGAGTQESTARFVSESCIEQVLEVSRDLGDSEEVARAEADELCTGTVISETSEEMTASVDEVARLAESESMSPAQASMLVERAASGAIKYKKWTHAYWGGSIVEKHNGTTYYDGSKAWVKEYRGKAGSHVCHSEGSIGIGWAVERISCNKPTAASSADNYYRFDASVFFKGSPINLGVGLHFRVSANGATKSWQVGG